MLRAAPGLLRVVLVLARVFSFLLSKVLLGRGVLSAAALVEALELLLLYALFSHLLHLLVPLVLRQHRVEGFPFGWLLLLFLARWISCLKHEGSLVLQGVHVLFEALLVFLVSIKELHGSMEVLSCFLVIRGHHLIEELLLLLVERGSVDRFLLLF